MVGTLEDLQTSHKVMECLVPDWMKGLSEMHDKEDLHVHSKHKKVEPLNDEARNEMRKRLQPEYDLYNFVQERLKKQYEECLRSKLTA